MKEQKVVIASNEQSSRFSQNSATYKRRQHTETETRYRTPREKIQVSE